MNNILKLTTDKTEYVCSDAEQTINITNLNELGARNLFLSPDSINKYPIRHSDNDAIVVDTTIIGNNEAQMFRVFAEYDLQLMQVTNIQKSYEQNVDYTLSIKRGSWDTNTAYNIEAVIGEDECLAFSVGTIYSWDINGDCYEPTIRFSNNHIPAGEHIMKFRLCIGETNSETKATEYHYYCETEPMFIEILPTSSTPAYGGVYLDATEILFEANKTYYVPLKSTIKYQRLHPCLNIEYVYYKQGAVVPTTIQKRLPCELENNMLKITMPYYSDIPNCSSIRFSCALFEEPYVSGTTSWTSNLAYSTQYNAYYFTSIINENYPKV